MGNCSSKGNMVSYKVSVKTGDHIGDGTDANVHIKLYGEGNQTIVHTLNNCFKNNFERDDIDSFLICSLCNISKMQRVELWRDNCGVLSNWYLDWIEVTNKTTNAKNLFPGMKWIKENKCYFFNNIDSCLPQHDPNKESRKSELQDIQKEYQLRVKIQGLPAQVKELPEDEKFSCVYDVRIRIETVLNEAAKFCLECLEKLKCNGNEWKGLDDVRNMYIPFGFPKLWKTKTEWIKSSLLKLCTGIPEKFGVTEDIIRPFLEGKTMKEAMDGKMLFIIDLGILEHCPTDSECKMTCPFALLYFNKSEQLVPIAIQLFQNKAEDNPVFLPSDQKNTWMLAKMWYSLADSTYHQALTHLNFTHLMMEGISVAAKRNLAHSHPILSLLNPHFLYLMAIDSLALGTLINKGGIIDKTSNAGISGHFYLMTESMKWWSLDLHGTLPEELKSRGVLDPSILTGVYHMRDDALLLYDAIKNYVEKYVILYYSTEGSLTDDYELQNWGAELVKSRTEGGVGIRGVPNKGKFVTTDQLVITLTSIIYTCSVGHASANFQQYDEYGSPFNYPYALSGDPPKDKSPVTDECILQTIAKRPQLLELMAITKVLSQKATQSLGDFERQMIVDPPAVAIVQEFQKKLREIGKIIDNRNKKRKYPYEWLHPKAIPNAISI